MEFKTCKYCLIEKPINAFQHHKGRCNECLNIQRRAAYAKDPTKKKAFSRKYAKSHKNERKAYNDQYREENRDKINAQKREHYAANSEAIIAKVKAHYIENTQQILAYKKKYAQKNPEKINARNRKRILDQLQRVPKWLTEADFIEIEWAYKIARDLTKETGIPHEVDHIHPIKGKNISGLHCPQNLRVITAKENGRKKNKFPYIKE